MTTAQTQQKLTILLDSDLYSALKQRAGRGNIGRFVSDVIRPHVLGSEALESAYKEMSADTEREKDAQDWSENLING